MTVATKVLSTVYPVAAGAGAALGARAVLEMARRVVLGKNETPSDRDGGGTALVWTILSWVVSVGFGIYAGKSVVAKSAAIQPAQS
ncbi:MAG TPA: hypothetical protein VFU98_09795 [Microlunatus sp.]|nr:hypothetical protein [Microlunatus sp.]